MGCSYYLKFARNHSIFVQTIFGNIKQLSMKGRQK
jgi:hypothetical protein